MLAGLPRCWWQLGASGWCEKVPNIAIEPGRALGAVPWADPARCAHVQLLFDMVLADGWLSTLHGPNQPSCAFLPVQRDSGSLPSLAQHYQPRRLRHLLTHLHVGRTGHQDGPNEHEMCQAVPVVELSWTRTSGGKADPRCTAVLCQCWIVGARSPALGAAYLRRAQLGVRDAGSMHGTSRGDVCSGEGLGCFGSVVI